MINVEAKNLQSLIYSRQRPPTTLGPERHYSMAAPLPQLDMVRSLAAIREIERPMKEAVGGQGQHTKVEELSVEVEAIGILIIIIHM